jgi:flavin-dependent dehydrogenase
VADFAGTVADVGISSISTYANAQHYRDNLERQAEDLFHHLPTYERMFYGASVVPGSAFYKPSPVLQPVRRMAGERYLLVGDAAGHATPYIGEGIRPGIEMGRAAAELAVRALTDGDLSARRLRTDYEAVWWERYGRYDLWSDLFRHFSSTCFKDAQWDEFMEKLQGLTAEEFYSILKSEYELPVVRKMFPVRLAFHYLRYQARRVLGFLLRRLSLREAASWIK